MIQTIVKVEGMMCGMCEAHVNDAIRKAVPAKKVTSSHKKGETETPLTGAKFKLTRYDEEGSPVKTWDEQEVSAEVGHEGIVGNI